jgi:hypothetical protein
MRFIIVLMLTALCWLPARAQEPGSPDAKAAAQELASILSADMIGQMTQAMTAQIWPKLQAAFGGKVDAATLAELRAEFEKSLKDFVVEATKDAPAIYAKHFTAQELREMTAFYRTPTGAKALRMMPQVMAEYFGSLMPRMEAFDRDLKARISAILARHGIK